MKPRIIYVLTAILIITGTKHLRAQPDQAQSTKALAQKIGCFECHGMQENSIGPSFSAIAARYQDSTGTRQTLIKRVKKGVRGKWPEISRGTPMPPYTARLSDSEVENLVDWILNLEVQE